MEAESKTIKIKNDEYFITGLGGAKQILLLSRLCEIAGVPVAAVMDVAFGTVTTEDGGSLDVDLEKTARGLVAGLANGERNLDTVLMILGSTSVGKGGTTLGDRDVFDAQFNRKISTLGQLLIQVLRFQFADFFEPGGIVPRYTAKLKEYLSSPDVKAAISSRLQNFLSPTGNGTSGGQS